MDDCLGCRKKGWKCESALFEGLRRGLTGVEVWGFRESCFLWHGWWEVQDYLCLVLSLIDGKSGGGLGGVGDLLGLREMV